MSEEQNTQEQPKQKILQNQVPTYDQAIHVAKTLTILCGFASTNLAWDSESGYFYNLVSRPDGSKAWQQFTKVKPRKLALPMIELLKQYAHQIKGSNMYICTPNEVQAIFFKLFNIK